MRVRSQNAQPHEDQVTAWQCLPDVRRTHSLAAMEVWGSATPVSHASAMGLTSVHDGSDRCTGLAFMNEYHRAVMQVHCRYGFVSSD
jgi:hypothetical protein